MITKIIACSDIHIPPYRKIGELHGTLERFIKQCADIVEENGRDNVRIIIAGDVFDAKLSITNESLLEVNWFFSELDKICVTYVIAGNHDLLMSNMDRVDSLTPLFAIGQYKNVRYVDQELDYRSGIITDDNIRLCSFSTFDGFQTPQIKAEREKSPDAVYVGVIHGDINGAISVTSYVTENGIEPAVFEDCDFVIAGHIHKRQEIKKNGVRIVYCSSMRQKEFGESVTGHGFVLWNLDDEDITYKFVDIVNEDGGFYKFSISDKDDIINDKEELINY
jgi:DNA repair exonuclease SbcCD nuclease subunit